MKLLILTVKTISKPFSKRLKEVAKDSDKFKDYCITVGNFVNNFTHSVNVRFIGGRQIKLKPLGESEAISRGAEVVGEGFVFTVSMTLLLAEYARRDYTKGLEAEEKQRKKNERRLLKNAQVDLLFERLAKEIKVLRRKIEVLEVEVHENKDPSTPTTAAIEQTTAKHTNTKESGGKSSKTESKGWGSSLANWWPFYVEVIEAPPVVAVADAEPVFVPPVDTSFESELDSTSSTG